MSTISDTGRALAETDPVWLLRLYVAGQSRKSLYAFANLEKLCETHLAGRYEIETIDIAEHPMRARDDDILAIPTLVRRHPSPVRKVIGDLSDTGRVLGGLRLDEGLPTFVDTMHSAARS